ncbi:MAG: hypothetical protein JWN34_3749 [Bryobacterales bacterium]|nr:hypothetical protein [Bryobacterales bacterium]
MDGLLQREDVNLHCPMLPVSSILPSRYSSSPCSVISGGPLSEIGVPQLAGSPSATATRILRYSSKASASDCAHALSATTQTDRYAHVDDLRDGR